MSQQPTPQYQDAYATFAQMAREDGESSEELSSGELISRITRALGSFAQTVPNMIVPKIAFKQEPVDEDQIHFTNGPAFEHDLRWEATAQLTCLGHIDGGGPEFLEGAKPTTVLDRSWSGRGQGFDEAVRDLAKNVQEHLHGVLIQRQRQVDSAQEALTSLTTPGGELSKLWRTEDPPEDDDQEVGDSP